MYTLLNGMCKYLLNKDEYFVLILGLDNAGKTTYLEQTKTKFTKHYKGINPSKITTTVGLNLGEIETSNVRLRFWDLGGQEELQSLWDKYYAESHAIIYLVDSYDRERLHESKETFSRMITNSSLRGVPLLLLANKQDLDHTLSVADLKSEFHEFARSGGIRDCKVMGTSALNGEGVNEGIEWLVQCVKRNSMDRPPTLKDIT